MSKPKKRKTDISSDEIQTENAAAVTTSRPRITRMIQNYHLVWLDGNIDEESDDQCRNSIMKLRQIVNIVNTFTDVDECIDFITDISQETSCMIVSEKVSRIIIPIAQEIPQVNSIYIFCDNEAQQAKSEKKFSKMKGVFTDITSVCTALKQVVQQYDHNSISPSFIKPTDGTSKQRLDTLDQSFMYTQILKEILLTIDFEHSHINEFLTFCREQYADNLIQLTKIDKIQKEYRHHQPIWWYTYESILYSMLNRALRFMDVDLIIKMGFFLRDLHQHITELHAEQFSGQNHLAPITAYRGQGLSQTDFDQLKQTQDGLMSFNNFLSTSLDQVVSRAFAESSQDDPNLIGVLFEITISPSISSSPFANIEKVTYYHDEEEILFSMHSVFRIEKIQPIEGNNRLWQVNLTLTSDNDPQLHALTKSIQQEIEGSTGWFRLGKLMITLEHFKKAEELYEILLKQTDGKSAKAHIFHHLGCVKDGQGEYAEALSYYERTLEIWQKILPANHPTLAASYNNIGRVYKHMGEYSKAFSYYEKAFEICQQSLPANHPLLATFYNNMGETYCKMGEHSKSLSYCEKALKIDQNTLPANHPALATSYNNIGGLYDNMGEYSKALLYYEKVLEIQQTTLPANHPALATSYNNIGGVYNKIGEYSKVLSYYEKALEISQKTLPVNHPDLATFYNNIGGVYKDMGEYSKVLSYYEKALEIRRKTLPENHPDLAQSYNNIGGIYYSMGEYSKVLSYYEKALEIRQKNVFENHPLLAISYNNVGGMYYKMTEYSKALSYYEKALEIQQKTLSENHPHLAISYNNIGGVYGNVGEYSKAFSYYEKALEIRQKALPENHPDLALSYNNIGGVYNKMGEYSKVLSYYEKALEMRQKALPSNHPDLAQSYNNIGEVYNNMGEYSKALPYFEHALDIRQISLPPDHPHLKDVKENIEIVKQKL